MAMKEIYVEVFLPYEGETASRMDQCSVPSEFRFSWQVYLSCRDQLTCCSSSTIKQGGGGWVGVLNSCEDCRTIQASFPQASLCSLPEVLTYPMTAVFKLEVLQTLSEWFRECKDL